MFELIGMKHKTALKKYLNIVKRRAERFNLIVKVTKENNINVHDPDLEYRYEHLRKEWINLQSDIHIYGFKYRLEVNCPYRN